MHGWVLSHCDFWARLYIIKVVCTLPSGSVNTYRVSWYALGLSRSLTKLLFASSVDRLGGNSQKNMQNNMKNKEYYNQAFSSK